MASIAGALRGFLHTKENIMNDQGAGAGSATQEPTLENAVTSLLKLVEAARAIEDRVMNISLQLDRPAPQPPSQPALLPQGRIDGRTPGETSLPSAIIPAFHELIRAVRMSQLMTSDHLTDINRKIGVR